MGRTPIDRCYLCGRNGVPSIEGSNYYVTCLSNYKRVFPPCVNESERYAIKQDAIVMWNDLQLRKRIELELKKRKELEVNNTP